MNVFLQITRNKLVNDNMHLRKHFLFLFNIILFKTKLTLCNDIVKYDIKINRNQTNVF